VLAALLLAQPAPQLLLLDEPTNNLDLASVRQLSQALEGYRGAILIAGHDLPFLRSAGISRWFPPGPRRRPDRHRAAVSLRVGCRERSPLDCVSAPGRRVRCHWGMG
jgi:hypothetical protein